MPYVVGLNTDKYHTSWDCLLAIYRNIQHNRPAAVETQSIQRVFLV